MKEDEKQRNYELAEKLLAEQNFAAAVIAGAVAAMLAAVIYGITIAIWDFSYGFAAAGIGIAVGLAMQFLGRGIEMKFAVAASGYTIVGCILGELFGDVMRLPIENAISSIDVFRSHAFSVISRWSISYVSFIDLVFWFVAVAAAIFLVNRPLSRAEGLAISTYEMKY